MSQHRSGVMRKMTTEFPSIQPPQHRHNFVDPGPAPITTITPRREDILPPAAMPAIDTPMPAQVRSSTTGSHLDRARAFRLKMLPVAAVAGVLGSIAGASLFGVPWLSFALLMWFFTVFCATWLIGYTLDLFVSADGAAILQILGMYRLLSREQKARLRRMERDQP